MKKEINTTHAPRATGLLSQAVEANGFVYVSGQIHNTVEGELLQSSTSGKVEQIMQNVAEILKAAGLGLDDIVKVTIYVTDMSSREEINQIYPTFFAPPYPARDLICVKELPLGASIEISVVAAI